MLPAAPVRRRFLRPLRAFACPVLLIVVMCAAPSGLLAAGLAWLPGATASQTRPGGPDLSVLTWELPGGLLVADRLAPGATHRFGAPFVPVFAGSEWFLVQPKGHAHDAAVTTAALAAVGRVHLATDVAWVVEVAASGQDAFAALDLCRQRIRLDAPPAGWDRVPAAAAVARADKDLALKTTFVDAVSQPAIFRTIREISGDTIFVYGGQPRTVLTRFYNTSDKTLVADYLAAQLAGWGYVVTFDPFTYNGVACRNVVATKTGATLPDEYFVVSGHYDSTARNSATVAPGAEDNASGTALVMELARIAADRDFDRSVQFVLFDAEERGLIGSDHFVDDAVAAGRNIVGALVHDMVAFQAGNYAVRIEGQTPWEWLMAAMAANVTAFTDIGFQKDYYSFGSDHVPFQQAGIAAFLAIDFDYDAYTPYHTSSDTWSAIEATAPLATQICRAGAGTLADVAGLRPQYLAAADHLQKPFLPVLTAAPNPFNPRVTVAFTLAAVASGDLAVFDLAGRRVRLLAAGPFAKGAQSFTWDGTDDGGRALASGSYLCRLSGAQGVSAVRMSLVR